MSGTTTTANRKADTPVRRVLVVFDAAGGGLHPLETAAGIAAGLKAELLGLFVEDERLTRLAELPCTGAVDPFSSAVREIDAAQMLRRMHLRSARARRALEAAARGAMVRHSFLTVSASPEVSLPGLGEGDLLMVAGRGWEGAASGPAMILYGRWDARTPVTVLYDGSEETRRALEVASALARAVSARLIVAVDPSVKTLPGGLPGEGGVEVRRLRSAAIGGEGLLVVAGGGGYSGLAGRSSRPVLIVR